MNYLYDKLVSYSKLNKKPFHMPGHKRRLEMVNPYSIDITEIDGFDDLQNPQSIILDIMNRAKRIYGSGLSLISCNGSTNSNLAAITSTTSIGGTLLVIGSPHVSVENASYIRRLNIISLPMYKEKGIDVGFDISILDDYLKKNSNIEAVFLTCPSYEGIAYDVKVISDICHEYKKPLIVDEAHGAHFFYDSYFPKSALKKGADIVVNSLHKTLPSMTSTGLCHLGKDSMVSEEALRRAFMAYHTTSPSYVLMASIDRCLEIIDDDGDRLFSNYINKLEKLYCNIEPHLVKFSYDIYDRDRSKILLKNTASMMNLLKPNIDIEKITDSYILLMTSIMDDDNIEYLMNLLG